MLEQVAPVEKKDAHLSDIELDPVERYRGKQRGKGVLAFADFATSIPFPEEVGGAGGTSLQYAIAVEELTRVDSSVAITMCAHTSLGTQPIYLFGSTEQKQRYLPDLCAGRKLGAFGLTEPEAGSDAGNNTHPSLAGGWRLGDRRGQAVHHQRRYRDLRSRRNHGADR